MDSVDRLDGGPYDENPQDGMGVLSPDLIYLVDYIHYLPEGVGEGDHGEAGGESAEDLDHRDAVLRVVQGLQQIAFHCQCRHDVTGGGRGHFG